MSGEAASALSPGQSALRFVLELAALACWAIAGWQVASGSSLRWTLAIGLPLVAAVAWGTFRVPGDRSANGEAIVPVTGRVRLLVEMLVLVGAAAAVGLTGNPLLGAGLALVVSIHYGTAPRRTAWLWVEASSSDAERSGS